jgi:hypothetical protein
MSISRRGFLGRMAAVALVVPALPAMIQADAERRSRRELLPVERRGRCYMALLDRNGIEVSGNGYERSEVQLRARADGQLEPYCTFPIATAAWGVVSEFAMWRDGHLMADGKLATDVFINTANTIQLHNFIGVN